ncbi:MAG: hypothetical protein DYH08_04865 [Actinobacteria bacterium ATB1]|nr:hypothetical protein [Actinobacteria bacterium ATB1]
MTFSNRRSVHAGLVALIATVALAASACSAAQPPSARVNGERIEQSDTFDLLDELGKLQLEAGQPQSVEGQVAGSFDNETASQVLTLQITVLLIEQFADDQEIDIDIPEGGGLEELGTFVQTGLQQVFSKLSESELEGISETVAGNPDVVCAIALLGEDEVAIETATAPAAEEGADLDDLSARFPGVQFRELCLLENQISAQVPGALGDALRGLEIGEVSAPASTPETGTLLVAFVRVERASADAMAQVAFSLWLAEQDVWVNSEFGDWEAAAGPRVVPPKAPAATGEPEVEDQGGAEQTVPLAP